MRRPTRALRPSGLQMLPDLLLNRLLDAVDLLHTIHVLIDRPWIGPGILGARLLPSLQQQEIGTLARHDKGEGKLTIIGMPNGVAHRAHVLSRRLHRALLLQHGRRPMFPLDLLGQTVEHAGNRREPEPRQRKPPFNIGLHGDPLLLVLARERLTHVKVSAEPLPLFRLPLRVAPKRQPQGPVSVTLGRSKVGPSRLLQARVGAHGIRAERLPLRSPPSSP